MKITIIRKSETAIHLDRHGEAMGEAYPPGVLSGDYFFRDHSPVYSEDSLAGIIEATRSEQFRTVHNAIDGAYDLVAFDRERNTVSVTSDPYGLNRLYYRVDDDRLEIADTISPLTGGSRKGLSKKDLCEYLRFLDISSPATIFDGIRCLEPGNVLTY